MKTKELIKTALDNFEVECDKCDLQFDVEVIGFGNEVFENRTRTAYDIFFTFERSSKNDTN